MRPRLACFLCLSALACSSPSQWETPPPAAGPAASGVPQTRAVREVAGPGLAGLADAAPLVCAVRNGADGRALILGLWGDGRVVWSQDPIFGGPPYLEYHLDAEQIQTILYTFERLFSRWGPDVLEFHPQGAEHVELVCHVGGRDRRLASWHERFERSPTMVVTPDGVELLAERDRREVWAQAGEDYQRFRVLWNDVRRVMRGLVPERPVAEGPVVARPDGLVLPAPR
ncbi:MAG: hypothetical protein O2816_04005 [Planctomycetota bacterium]|nr:hypothetical protein [Planctomycetota bacterium]